MSTPSFVNNHVQQALDRLLEQYKTLPHIEGLIQALTEQIQFLEEAFQDSYDYRTIQDAFGYTLDLMGTIVGQDRLGFDDAFFRALIQAKIGENVSQGDPERVIQITKLLTGATLVFVQNYYPAGFGISASAPISPSLINFFYQRLDKIDPVAVRLEALISFDPDDAFAFEGGPLGADGFSSTTSPLTGGMFGYINIRTKPEFAFKAPVGMDEYEGFGTLQDIYVGGIMEGL